MDSNPQAFNELCREILINISDGVFLTDDQDRFVWVCPNIEGVFGWTDQEVLAMGHLGALVGNQAPIVWREQQPTGAEHHLEWSITHKAGHQRILSVKVKRVQLGNGRKLYTSRDITEHKQAEKALRESEERYRSLFVSSLDAVLLTAPDGQVLAANETACRMFGRTEEELRRVGRNGVVDLTDSRLTAALEERARTGKFSGELMFVRQDGTRFPGEISSAIFRERNGQLRTSMTIRDITERKQAEAVIRGLAEFPQENPGPVLRTNRCGTIIYANTSARELLAAMAWVPPAPLPEPLLGAVRHVLARNTRHEIEFTCADGLFFCFSLVPSMTEGHVNLYGRDMTKRKRAEEALQESEERYRAVVEDQTEVICRIRPDGTLTFVNDVYCRFFGKTSQEILGQKWQPRALPEDLPLIEEKLRTLSPTNPVVVIENRVFSAGGQIQWMQFVNRAFFDAQGVLMEIQCVGRNITLLKKLEEELLESRQLIRQLAAHSAETEEKERKRLARELHDQVGQNLTAISLSLTSLKSQLAEHDPATDWKPLADALKMVEQTTEQVRNVMAELRPPVLDDYGLLAALRWYGDQFARRTGIDVFVSANRDSIRLACAVEHALFRITQEALTNVSKHACARRVDIWLEASAGGVVFEIDDDGQGFDLSARPSSAGRQGWGMLTMSERAAGIGGTFRVESSLGRGTSIIVEVPA